MQLLRNLQAACSILLELGEVTALEQLIGS